MGIKKVLITVPEGCDMFRQVFPDSVLNDLRSFAEVSHNTSGKNFTTEELAERAQGMDAILSSWGVPRITVDVAKAAPSLKIVAHAAGSIKHFVDEGLFDMGLTITNAASVMAPSVGEHTLALTLSLLRNIPQHYAAQTESLKGSTEFTSNEGLFGQRVGLIGLGHTGREFLKLLKPFDVDAVAYDPYCPQEKAETLGVRLVGLEELLSTSKVISLHAAVTEETKGMLDGPKLKLIKDGAVFVNTARGIIIDHDALAAELRTGRIKAALDVTYPEPLPINHELRHLPNVIITPHIAGPTWDRRWLMSKCAVEDLKLFFEGKTPINLVTKRMLDTMA